MENKILVCYESVTGFTKDYAEMVALETGATVMPLKDVTAETVAGYGTVVFGGRLHAGTVDGLKRVKTLMGSEKRLVVFATGATPATEEQTIQKVWEDNLTADELDRVPHFYLPGGLRYERMPWHERLMMRAFAAVMKRKVQRKPDKTEEDLAFGRMISASYDISSREYIDPLLNELKKDRPST